MAYLTAYKGEQIEIDDKFFSTLKNEYVHMNHNVPEISNYGTLVKKIAELEYEKIPDGKKAILLDKNPLNCKLSNIRVVSDKLKSIHARNKNLKRGKTSQFRGVSKITKHSRRGDYYYWTGWCKNPDTGKQESKNFPYTPAGELAAARWYNIHAYQYYGELAIINDIPKE